MAEQLVNTDNDEFTVKDVILSLKKWIKFIKSKWVPILITSIVFGILGLVYSFIKKPVYKAELSFALEESKGGGGLGAYSGLASQFGLDVGGNAGSVFSGDNLIELMKSRSMIQKTLLSTVNVHGKNETLAELYIDFNNFRENWKKTDALANIKFQPGIDSSKLTLTQDSILAVFRKNLILSNLIVEKIDKKLSIIVVTVKSKNELFSKYFSEILAEKVSQFYIETRTKKASQNVKILQRQTDSVRLQLNKAISGVAASVDVNPNANPNRQILRIPAQHKQVDIQVNTAILAELVKNLEVAKVSLRNETPLIQVIDEPILPLEFEQVGKLKGAVLGILLGAIAAILFVSIKNLYKNILN